MIRFQPMLVSGIAAAITGRTFNRFTTSVLEGRSKDSIVINPQLSYKCDFPPPSNSNGIGKVISRFFGTIAKVTKNQQTTSKGSNNPQIQAALGLPSGFNQDLFTQLLSPLKRQKSRIKTKDSQWLPDILRALLEQRLKKDSLLPNSVRFQTRFFDIRDFLGESQGLEIIYSQVPNSTSLRILEDPTSRRLTDLYEQFQADNPDAKNRIKEIVISLAKGYAQQLKDQIPNPESTRFMLYGGPNKPPNNTNPRFTCITWDPEFRTAFINTLREELKIKPEHNFVLKCPTDPQSPPYSDVVRAMMMDLL